MATTDGELTRSRGSDARSTRSLEPLEPAGGDARVPGGGAPSTAGSSTRTAASRSSPASRAVSSSDRTVDALVAAGRPLADGTVGGRLDGACRRRPASDVPVEVHLGAVEGAAGRRTWSSPCATCPTCAEARRARFEAEAKYRLARRGHPRDRVPRPGRREPELDLREPAGRRTPRHQPRGVAHRSVLLASTTCTRRTSDRAWDEYVGGLSEPRSPSTTSTGWSTRTATCSG